MDKPGLPCNNIEQTLLAVAHVVEKSMGGSSGAVCQCDNNNGSYGGDI